MSRIMVTTIGSLGDLHPKIAIALELRKRGHDVVFATHKEYQDKIEALGFEFYRMRPDNTALSNPQEMARLKAGYPTLIMPYSHDQPDNAARVERLGTSLTISRKQYSAARVAQRLGELLENPNYAAKAADIGRIIQKEDGVGVACDAIEKQLLSIRSL